MVDPAFLYSKVKTQIQGLTHLPLGNVFDGEPPKSLPTDVSGYVLPYVCIYSGLGGDLPEFRDFTRLTDTTVMDWPFQTTCVASSLAACQSLSRMVALALTNLPVARGFVKPDPDGFRTNILPDNTVTPVRYFLPLPWRLTTT